MKSISLKTPYEKHQSQSLVHSRCSVNVGPITVFPFVATLISLMQISQGE